MCESGEHLIPFSIEKLAVQEYHWLKSKWKNSITSIRGFPGLVRRMARFFGCFFNHLVVVIYAICPQNLDGPGEYCFLRGLVSAAHLNGKIGRMCRHKAASSEGRVVVELRDGSEVQVKYDNLERFAKQVSCSGVSMVIYAHLSVLCLLKSFSARICQQGTSSFLFVRFVQNSGASFSRGQHNPVNRGNKCPRNWFVCD
jgi:hypothetical protein